MEQITFDDVAVYFTEEEWEYLQPEQRSLYKEVISDNYQMILSLNRPDIITNIELGYEPYIASPAPRSLPDFQHTEFLETSETTLLQENSHDTRVENRIGSVGQLKRQRRYPRVNPLRWLKKYKKSNRRSHRIAKRSEHDISDNESRTAPRDSNYGASTDPAEEAGGGAEEALNGSLDRMESDEETSEPVGHSSKASDQSTQTGNPDSEYKPEYEQNVAACIASVDAEKPEKSNPRAEPQRDNPSNATNPLPSPPKGTGVLKEVQGPAAFNQGTGGRNSGGSLQRKEKHVQFSDKITTFVFEPQMQECFQEGPADRVKLRSRSPPYPSNTNVSPKLRPSPEPKLARSSITNEENQTNKVSRPNTLQQESRKVATADKSEEESQEAKLQNGVKCHKKMKKVEAKGDPSQKSASSSSLNSPSQKRPRSNLEKKDAGTQIDRFSVEEEEPKPPMPTALPPSPAYPTDLTLIKSYSCSNCGKTTHWTRLSDQQKANVEKSVPYTCKMCSRQREKLKVAESPGKIPGISKLGKAAASPDKVTGAQNSQKLAKAGDPLEKTSPQNSPLPKMSRNSRVTVSSDNVNGTPSPPLAKLGKTAESPERTTGPQNSPLTKVAKSGKAALSPGDKANGLQNTPLTKVTKPGKAALSGSPSRKKPYCKLPAEKTDSPAAKKQKPDKDVNWEDLSKSLKSSPGHIQTRESTSHKTTASEPQSLHTKWRSTLCRRCTHSGLSEGHKPYQKLTSVNETPTKSSSIDQASSPVPHQKLKSVNGSPTNQISNPDSKRNAPEKRKAIEDLQNGTSDGAELLPSPGAEAPSGEGAEGQKKQEVCTNCGKRFMMKRRLQALNSVEHTSSSEKMRKTGAKPNSTSNKAAKLSPKDKKTKKPASDRPKTPKVAKSQLCTKCGKRLVLHVPPEERSGEGGNENECVVLLRKKRKRPLAGMEPFTCLECGKIFTRHFSLMQHRFIHTGERPYSCKVCRKSFRDSGYLTVHMRSHTKEKPYSCTECGKTFAQHSALVVHQRTHTDERPFQCKDCGKSFTDRSTFRNHQRIHTGEKPYACSYCGKKFTQQPHMKRHESIHTGDRPFRCRECGKRFIDRTKLKKHELIHTRWEN